DRVLPTVGMLYHRRSSKGSELGVRALTLVREEFPSLKAILFGVPFRPLGLPRWIRYVRQPNGLQLKSIYNGCTVFLQTSLTEGWGLTATESMACGCALVTTSNGGSRDYAFDGETALVVDSRSHQDIALAIAR